MTARKDELLGADYQAPTESFWEIERMAGGDGYDVMTRASQHGWRAVAGWGRDGWDLGSWPLVVIYVRHVRGDAFELAYYVEGDVTVYRYAAAVERASAIDALAFFHWRAQGESWVAGVETADDAPADLCGPYNAERAA